MLKVRQHDLTRPRIEFNADTGGAVIGDHLLDRPLHREHVIVEVEVLAFQAPQRIHAAAVIASDAGNGRPAIWVADVVIRGGGQNQGGGRLCSRDA